MRLKVLRAWMQRVQVCGQLMMVAVFAAGRTAIAVVRGRTVAVVDRCGFHLVVQVLIDRVIAVRVAARVAKLLAD